MIAGENLLIYTDCSLVKFKPFHSGMVLNGGCSAILMHAQVLFAGEHKKTMGVGGGDALNKLHNNPKHIVITCYILHHSSCPE